MKATPENVQLVTMNAIKETMKMMKSVKRKRKESSSDSDDNQGPILVNKTFKVKDNGHDVLDFEVRNKLRTINAKPDTYFKYLVKES